MLTGIFSIELRTPKIHRVQKTISQIFCEMIVLIFTRQRYLVCLKVGKNYVA